MHSVITDRELRLQVKAIFVKYLSRRGNYYLFGSRAGEGFSEHSDYDFGIDTGETGTA